MYREINETIISGVFRKRDVLPTPTTFPFFLIVKSRLL